jgi:hypothetical protein
MDNHIRAVEDKSDNLVLLKLEDEIFRTVLNINQKYVDIIQSWYEKCDYMIHIEYSSISIPSKISNANKKKILYRNIDNKNKELFINSYIPEILAMETIHDKIKDIEKSIFTDNLVGNPDETVVKMLSLTSLGINIPNEITGIEIKNTEQKITDRKTIRNANLQLRDEPPVPITIVTPFNQTTIQEYYNAASDLHKTKKFNSTENFISGRFPECNIQPYNFEYNALKHSIFDNVLRLDVVKDISEFYGSKKDETIIVLLNPLILQTVVITNPSSDVFDIIIKYPEYGFIELFKMKFKIEDVEKTIYKNFDGVKFDSAEKINIELINTAKMIELIKNNYYNNGKYEPEEVEIKEFLKKFYELNNNEEDRIKLSELHTVVSNFINKETDDCFKVRLSKYLKDLGIHKKLYDDGCYYCGIKLKQCDFPFT